MARLEKDDALSCREMDPKLLVDGLILYLALLILLTFHEFGHAWMAWKCGDDTARLQGRVSLNPIVHIDLIGTVVLPLLMIFLSMTGSGLSRFLLGWAKPVPVNPYNLRNPRMDDMMVTLAGPWMNLLLAIVFMGLARIGYAAHYPSMVEVCKDTAHLSLLLCWFNLLPIPPLDGSQAARSLLGISHETYQKVARYGFIILIVVIQIPMVQQTLTAVTNKSWAIIGDWFGMPLA